jgi:hypothetical protein
VCFKLGDSATTTHRKLQQAFGDDAMSRAQHKPSTGTMCYEGRTLVEEGQVTAQQGKENLLGMIGS